MSKRIEWIDLLKGLAIILVVIGHVADGYINSNIFLEQRNILDIIFNIIYSFHMPLFFIASGILANYAYFSDKDIKKDKIKRQILNLIYLYFFFSIIQWGVKYFTGNNVNNTVTINDLLLIFVKPMPPYWYIYDLIIFYSLSIFLHKSDANKNIVLLICTLSICMLSLFKNPFMIRIYSLIKYFIFFYIGLNYNILYNIFKNNKYICIASTLIVIFIEFLFIFINKTISKTLIIDVIIGYIISMLIIQVFSQIKNINKYSVLKYVGKYSTEIYLIHSYFTYLNRIILLKINISNFCANFLANCFISIIACIIISKVLKKLNIYNLIFNPMKYLKEGNKK